MATDSVYHPEDLAAFDVLSTPVWIVDFERGHQWWANLACLPMWGATDREQLLAASAAGPGPSPTSRLRLEQLQRRLERGERAVDRWTLYPDHAKPFVAECRQQGVRIADRRGEASRFGMLIEARVLGEHEAELQDRRGIEALRYLGELVSLYSEAGEVLMRNPAAAAALGEPGPGDAFAAGFVDPGLAAELRARLTTGAARLDAAVRTTTGERWFDTAVRRSLDPVSGAPALLVTQSDITERRAHLAEIERNRQQIADQADALLRLAAPVIRIGAGVLALPLIGVLDRERVEAALAALLAHTDRARVERVVVDLTGAAVDDAEAAAGVLRIVRVLRLQGVAAALSGVRPPLARTIVDAGVDLSEVRCYQSLEHALARR
ncbi:STAS domain-containing protein [Nannocystis bainbridge]|uniref:STAS domain-containing protein n=1 Tax=Nannocystis bainbridge TaxID=2995303 RepID=A0ABT5E1B6_9BACT|nr:STAS domain-containing protein [Nannocystis bainbridge]MDC0718773.1 STAS domain-containing protein [Nannocystis bainbridge]